MTSEPTWFASVTGRVGVAANTLLFYVKGGGAWMHIEHVQDVLTGGATAATQSISDTRSGFVAGVGLEYALTQNLSALFEYDFYDFGTKTENFCQHAAGDPLRFAHADGGSQLPLQLGLDRRAVLPDLLSPVFRGRDSAPKPKFAAKRFAGIGPGAALA